MGGSILWLGRGALRNSQHKRIDMFLKKPSLFGWRRPWLVPSALELQRTSRATTPTMRSTSKCEEDACVKGTLRNRQHCCFSLKVMKAPKSRLRTSRSHKPKSPRTPQNCGNNAAFGCVCQGPISEQALLLSLLRARSCHTAH